MQNFNHFLLIHIVPYQRNVEISVNVPNTIPEDEVVASKDSDLRGGCEARISVRVVTMVHRSPADSFEKKLPGRRLPGPSRLADTPGGAHPMPVPDVYCCPLQTRPRA